MSPITLAVLDMAGTTVADDGLVLRAFAAAAEAGGLPAEGPEADAARQYVLDTMGQSKVVTFRAIFGDENRAQAANAAFETTYDSLIDQGLAEPIPGAEKAITTLREAGIKVALTTGFSRSTQDKLLVALGWETLANLTLSPAEAGRGRPYPDLILTALLKLSIDDVHQIAVLGDTSNDVLSGIRSGPHPSSPEL